MTATATRTRTAPKSATLLGIDKAQGDGCDDCGRELSARLFRVRVTATGEVRHLGRRCAARATGYPTTRLEHEAAAAERLAAWEAEVAATWTVERMADHFRDVVVIGADDLIEVWIGGDRANGTHTIPVVEHAAAVLAEIRTRY